VTSIGEVSGIKTATDDQFTALLDRLLAVQWPVPAARAEALVGEWGWTVDEVVDETSIVIDPGLGLDVLDGGWVWIAQGEVSSVSLNTSDDVGQPTASTTAALRDVSARQASALVERLGPPSERVGGKDKQVVWSLPTDSRVVLYQSDSGLILEITSPTEGRARRDAP
jgi:hypothetical protein